MAFFRPLSTLVVVFAHLPCRAAPNQPRNGFCLSLHSPTLGSMGLHGNRHHTYPPFRGEKAGHLLKGS